MIGRMGCSFRSSVRPVNPSRYGGRSSNKFAARTSARWLPHTPSIMVLREATRGRYRLQAKERQLFRQAPSEPDGQLPAPYLVDEITRFVVWDDRPTGRFDENKTAWLCGVLCRERITPAGAAIAAAVLDESEIEIPELEAIAQRRKPRFVLPFTAVAGDPYDFPDASCDRDGKLKGHLPFEAQCQVPQSLTRSSLILPRANLVATKSGGATRAAL